MTKEQKDVQSWIHALKDDEVTETHIEFDVVDKLSTFPRVAYLISLGYSITNWTEYAFAEINELGSK